MQKGQIRVQTENIFPIIKKFLYSDHDIFLRELIANAVDATQKLKTYSSSGEAKGDLGELRIDVVLDKDAKTLTISDRGIGMTSEEVDKYINQVAFSSAEEFLAKYKGQNEANIIGHFGLGFYSGFMVSEKVQLSTLSYKEGSEAVVWECDGSPEKQNAAHQSSCSSTKKALNSWIASASRVYSKNSVSSFRCLSSLRKSKSIPPIRLG
jgi:molecular chaperone HtpG